MYALELSSIELEVLYSLVHEGKFKLESMKPELIGSPHVNDIINKILELHNQKNWNPKIFQIEDYPKIMQIIKEYLVSMKQEFRNLKNKESFIKIIVHPYKIENFTIENLIREIDSL